RMPREWLALESSVREALKARVERGKLNVSINRKRGAAPMRTLRLDQEVAGQYVAASREIGHLLGTDEPLKLNTLAQLPDVFCYTDEEEDLQSVKAALTPLLGEVVERLDAMRLVEGEALAAEVTLRTGLIHESLGRVEALLPELNRQHEERLRARIAELNETADVAEERLAIEVALMAEKGDVTEETVRLATHLDHVADVLASGEPAGRKLNFLSQEIQREINTLGSKVRDSEVSREVLEMKSELEKIREQIQNIE
ncbi:MAG: YicC/YloC family endoribonuclease, partial [Candidatus Hydrogenedentes bacterium]|nr:YicC/YloC family endoribonuclease [Candidatus Hydrogenedentota bacterium]